MKDGNPSRFRVVGGTETEQPAEPTPVIEALTKVKKPRKPRAKRPPMKDQITRFSCAECAAEMGFEQHTMVQVLRDPHEANGKLIGGGLWWACARCLKPYYFIRLFGERR